MPDEKPPAPPEDKKDPPKDPPKPDPRDSEIEELRKQVKALGEKNIAGMSESTGAAILESQKLLNAKLEKLEKRRRRFGLFF